MNDEVKILSFKNLVYTDARNRRDNLLEKLEQEKSRKISDAEAEIKDKYARLLKRGMLKADSVRNKTLATNMAEQKRELLNAREELINSVFNSVEEKLGEYLKSPEYQAHMKEKIDLALKEMSENAIIIVNENDEALKELGYKCEPAEDNFMGGCIVCDNTLGIRIDLTMKTKLEALRAEFLQAYKLKL